jgi:uridine kinase
MTDTGSGGEWTSVGAARFLDILVARTNANAPVIVGVNGHSRSGKTTLAQALARSGEGIAVIHTDDIAWHHSFFDWSDVLIDELLQPLRRSGPPQSFIPTPWTERGRPGSLNIPAGTRVVIVEGVGATRRELMPWLEATVWVDTDEAVAMERTVALDRDPPGFVRDWMAAERTHLSQDQPWTRSTATVSGERPFGRHRELWVRIAEPSTREHRQLP